MNPLVSTDWLADRLKEPDLRVLDAAWYMPNEPTTGRVEYDKEHLPGAVFFDIDAVADKSIDLPHMMPTAAAFAEAVGAMGVGAGDRVVVYDHSGLIASARAWWMFRTMGHNEVFVLDGGLPRWKAEGRPLTTEAPTPTRQVFEATFHPQLIRTVEQMKQALQAGEQVLDARSPGRFSGKDPEPRAGLSSGHMPGARNLPWQAVTRDGALLPPQELEAVYRTAGVDPDRTIIGTCGSGVSAAVLALGLARLGKLDGAVYDGSWTEWASRSDTQIVKD